MMETKNLMIRETKMEDVELFWKWEREPHVTKFFSIEDDQSREDAYQKYFADLSDPSARQFTILLKQETGEPKVIGRIVLAEVIEGWKAELWRIYIADLSLRGKGYGKQALLAIMKYCFEELKLERLYLDFYLGNPAEYLYRSVGFQSEGVLRRNCRKNGVLHDVHLVSMLRDEYMALNSEA